MSLIIKEGTPYRQHKCRKCETIFVYHLYYDDRDGYIRCPECKKRVNINKLKLDKKLTKKEYEELEKLHGEETNNS